MPLEEARKLSGMDFINKIFHGEFPAPPMSRLMDFRGIHVEKGRAVFEGIPSMDHYNPIGSVHGGYAATLLDSCMGCSVHSMLEAGSGYTTLEFKVNFVRAITSKTGRVLAEGKVVHFGKRTATAEGWIRDEAGNLLAHGTTTCLIFPI